MSYRLESSFELNIHVARLVEKLNKFNKYKKTLGEEKISNRKIEEIENAIQTYGAETLLRSQTFVRYLFKENFFLTTTFKNKSLKNLIVNGNVNYLEVFKKSPNVAFLQNDKGWTIGHMLAACDDFKPSKENTPAYINIEKILTYYAKNANLATLTTDNGNTIGHLAATNDLIYSYYNKNETLRSMKNSMNLTIPAIREKYETIKNQNNVK